MDSSSSSDDDTCSSCGLAAAAATGGGTGLGGDFRGGGEACRGGDLVLGGDFGGDDDCMYFLPSRVMLLRFFMLALRWARYSDTLVLGLMSVVSSMRCSILRRVQESVGRGAVRGAVVGGGSGLVSDTRRRSVFSGL